MKEKFEERRLFGKLNVACKFDDGSVRYWTNRKETVVQQIVEIVNYYEGLGYKLTLRQLHYQFVSRNWIINHDTAYKKLGKILDDCRYAGVIDWSSIEDRGRVPYLPYWVHNIPDALQDTVSSYRLNLQQGQDNHIEVWTEKDALSGIMRRSTSKYHVRLAVNKGYTSSSAIYNSYQRFAGSIEEGKRVIVLYFGDHDPSGLDMIRDIEERIRFMLSEGSYRIIDEDAFAVIPIGLTMQQIKKYNLPANPTKMTDSRSAEYVRRFGKTCWEVDALNPEILTNIVEQNIESFMDMDQFNDVIKKEESDILKLKKIIKQHE